MTTFFASLLGAFVAYYVLALVILTDAFEYDKMYTT
jgi:hypothetical protein